MIALIFIPIALCGTAYLYMWLIRWLSAISSVFRKKPVMVIIAVLMLLLTADIFCSFIFDYSAAGRFFKSLGNYWIAIAGHALFIVLAADLIRVIIKKIRNKNGRGDFSKAAKIIPGIICILLVAAIVIYGNINAKTVRRTVYDITVDKSGNDNNGLNIVLIADQHMGINIGYSQMQDMVDEINDIDPDIVLVAGDIFDNSYDALDDPDRLVSILGSIKSRYGVYAVYGNHDVDETLLIGFTTDYKGIKAADKRMDRFIEACGWINLRDEGVMIDDSFYLYGRPDHSKPGNGITQAKSPAEITDNIDKNIPVIVMEHQPLDLDELAAAGVDIVVSGHTHAGQVFPLTILNRIMWENGYGYLNKEGMHNIVTSGVGLYGPCIRTGTISEVVQIRIHFNNE